MNRDYYSSPKPGKIMRFFWKAAGGDEYLLKKATYSDQIKYFCLGGIILATGLMAGLAGGYAFYTIFSPKGGAIEKGIDMAVKSQIITEAPLHLPTVFMAIIFGVIWGLIIFNIDRFIVTSTGTGDGTEAITWGEFKSAIPRIIMGAIIAITISKPVEIRMFQSEIAVELYQIQDSVKQQFIENKLAMEQQSIKGLDSGEYKNILAEVGRAQELCDKSSNAFQQQMLGKNGAALGYGPLAKRLEQEKERNCGKLEKLISSPKYEEYLTKKSSLGGNKEDAQKEAEVVAAGFDGLLERIKILHKIAPNISLFIMLLFLAIELTPIFFKLMLIKTPYDFMKDNVSDLIKAESGIEVKYDYYEDKKGQDRHLVINHNADNMTYEKSKMAQAQKELIDLAVDEYKRREEQKIKENLEDYIKGLDIDPNSDKA
jgi:hypothetical protein